MVKRILHLTEQYISAGQYIPDHPKCGTLHGHTYFIRNLHITLDGTNPFLDLGDIKAVIKKFDHVMFVPIQHIEIWEEIRPILRRAGCRLRLVVIQGRGKDNDAFNIVEEIAERLADELLKLHSDITKVSFGMYEGPSQGVLIRRENK